MLFKEFRHYKLDVFNLSDEINGNSRIYSHPFNKFAQIHLSLMENRPGANTSSLELLDFTLARFIRLRLQGMHTTVQSSENNVQWLVDRAELNKRSFYSLQSIKIGARLECSGHASKATTSLNIDDVCICLCIYCNVVILTVRYVSTEHIVLSISELESCSGGRFVQHHQLEWFPYLFSFMNSLELLPLLNVALYVCILYRLQIIECECAHNTCGINCEKCCPMYNQRPYLAGTLADSNACEKCQVIFVNNITGY